MNEARNIQEWTYTKGSHVSLRLRFRPGTGKPYDRVWVEFAHSSGYRIRLSGAVEGSGLGEVSEVLLGGVVEERIELGLYRLASVQGDPGGNLWTSMFGELPFAIRIVPALYRGEDGSEFVALERV